MRLPFLPAVVICLFGTLALNSLAAQSHPGSVSGKDRLRSHGAATPPAQADTQQRKYPVDFSATFADYTPPYPGPSHNGGKIYVSKGRVRLEQDAQFVQLMDPTAGHVWLLMPEHKLAMNATNVSAVDRHSFGVSSSSRPMMDPIDLNQPCAAFKGITCRNLGPETVNGRATQKWEFTQMFGTHASKSYQWLDPKLLVAIKLEDRRSGRQLVDIKEGPQPEALFVIPANYQIH